MIVPQRSMPFGGVAAELDRGDYIGVGKTVLFNKSAYLNRTFIASDRQTWTFSAWVKLNALSGTAHNTVFSADAGGGNSFIIAFQNDAIVIQEGAIIVRVSTALFRDFSAPFHLVVMLDTTQAVADDRMTVWINGIEITSWSTKFSVVLNAQFVVNNSVVHRLGERSGGTGLLLNGYVSDITFVDGQALPPTDFGRYSADVTNWWVTKTYAGTYGTTGFKLNFSADNGDDSSGNGNNWTENNAPTYSFDIPGDNYNVMNPLDTGSNLTLTNGNKTVIFGGATSTNTALTMLITQDLTYMEVKVDAFNFTGPNCRFGITFDTAGVAGVAVVLGTGANEYVFTLSTGQIRNNGVDANYGNALVLNDVLQIAYNKLTGSIYFGRNDLWSNGTTFNQPFSSAVAAYTGLTGTPIFAIADPGSTTTGTYTIRVGSDEFTLTMPTDYLPLTSFNLPVPAVRNPQEHATVQLYVGNGIAIGSGGNIITGVGFAPDFVWMKDRDAAVSHRLFDSVRGIQQALYTDANSSQQSEIQGLNSFDADGFTVGNQLGVNTNANQYFSFPFLAGGAPVVNNDGSIQTSVSANIISGCSIGTYVGTGSAATIGHGLGREPDFVIIKKITGLARNWAVYHKDNTNSPELIVLFLDLNNSNANGATYWNSLNPDASVINIGTATQVNTSGDTHVFYAFVFGDVFAGGSYVGNGNANGTFVPEDEILMSMIKRASNSAAWMISDTVRSPSNPVQDYIEADTTIAENNSTSVALDYTTKGLKMRGTHIKNNAAGADYIYFGIKKKAMVFT